jgi:gliding motility-associated-like protein
MKKNIIYYFLLFPYFVFSQTVSGVASNNNCLNSVTITASSAGLGSTPQYQLLKSGIVVAPVVNNTTQFTSTNIFTGLSSGNYVLKARATSASTIFTSSAIVASDGYTQMNVITPLQTISCSTVTTALTSNVSGGKAPFKYSIAFQSSPTAQIQTSTFIASNTYTFSGLTTGNYIISVTDNCGQTITGSTSISVAGVQINGVVPSQLKLNRVAYGNCASKIRLRSVYGLSYCNFGGCGATATDKANYTWRLEFNGLSYGQDINADGDPDLAGADFPATINATTLPGGITLTNVALAGNPKYVLYDKCGNSRKFTPLSGNIGLNALVCGTTGTVNIGDGNAGNFGNTACFPINYIFRNTANPLDVLTYTQTTSAVSLSGFTIGATYTITYADGQGNTTGLTNTNTVTIPNTPTSYAIGNIGTNTNYYNAVGITLASNYNVTGDVITTTVTSSTVPGYTGYTTTNTINTTGFSFFQLTPPNGIYWPGGTYTFQVSGPCGTTTITRTVTGYTGYLNSLTTVPVCGGFDVTANTSLVNNRNDYEIKIISGPSNVGATRNLVTNTLSQPFLGLSYGTYVIGIRPITAATSVVFNTVTVNYTNTNTITIDPTNTGGYVCNATNGTLTITASSILPPPNNILQFALSLDGGFTYGAYQNSNTFNGLATGTYFYRIKDGCGNVTTQTVSIGNIVINQFVCVDTAMSPITYSVPVTVTGTTATGLPPGVTGMVTGSIYSISGTPTASGVYNYNVTSSGGCALNLSGTITVNPNTSLSLISSSATTTQSICINTPLTDIIYSIADGGTGATVTGLPTGITSNFTAGILKITGSSSVQGIFPFIVITTGGCSTASLSGTITVHPNTTISLDTSTSSTSQTVCLNNDLSTIQYAVGNGATGATVSGLPTGITTNYNAGTLTISGIPTIAGSFNYTVNTTGGCAIAILTGSITVVNPIIYNDPTDYEVCDDDTDGKVCAFDLHSKDIEMTNNPMVLISYHYTANEAKTGLNPISSSTTALFCNTIATSQTLYVRLSDPSFAACPTIKTMRLIVKSLPDPIIYTENDISTICVDYISNAVVRPLELKVKNTILGNYTYQWYENGVLIPEATAASYLVTTPAPDSISSSYTIKEVDTVTGCDITALPFTVIQSGQAVFLNSPTYTIGNILTDNQTIIVSLPQGHGSYQYSIDTGEIQESNVFENIPFGVHYITIWDTKGGSRNSCDPLVISDIKIMNYPHFFTPNGDGYNDTWNIATGLENSQQVYITIFDRFGKLLKEITTSSNGWDGTFNGEALPANDYWFSLSYQEEGNAKEFRGHFALKR